jgi:hypothetical protein
MPVSNTISIAILYDTLCASTGTIYTGILSGRRGNCRVPKQEMLVFNGV